MTRLCDGDRDAMNEMSRDLADADEMELRAKGRMLKQFAVHYSDETGTHMIRVGAGSAAEAMHKVIAPGRYVYACEWLDPRSPHVRELPYSMLDLHH